MRRRTEGLEPHKEDKIVLSRLDKVIFSVGAAVYGIAVITEEKIGKRNAVSSSFAIFAVGLFLFLRALQNKRTKELILMKDRAVFLLMLIGGALLGILGIASLVKDIIRLAG